MSLFSGGGLSKLLVSALAISGIAYPVYQLVNNSSTETVVPKELQKEQQASESKEKVFEPIIKKFCVIFLTSVDNNYKIVYCDEANSQKLWYLFDKNKHSLDKIEGLTSKNDPKVSLSSSLGDWKERKWTGFKKYDGRLYKANDPLESSFKIGYKSEATIFPFFDHFKGNGCLTSFNTYIRAGMSLNFSCSSFNITIKEFDKPLKRSDYQKSFSSFEGKECYTQYDNNKWKEINCQNEMNSQK